MEKVANPSKLEQINELHSEYTKKLKELFDEHGDACGVLNDTALVIQQLDLSNTVWLDDRLKTEIPK